MCREYINLIPNSRSCPICEKREMCRFMFLLSAIYYIFCRDQRLGAGKFFHFVDILQAKANATLSI